MTKCKWANIILRSIQQKSQKLLKKLLLAPGYCVLLYKDNFRVIDVESLCLLSGKRVWQILVQSTLLNNDGNLIDAFYLASILGLLNFRKP